MTKRQYNVQPNIITKSREEFSALEKRLVYLVINPMNVSMHSPELFQHTTYTVDLKDIGDNNYERLRDGLIKLQSKSIIIEDNKKQKNLPGLFRFLL